MTLALLWQEYKADHPDGLQYSWFCERYHQAWRGKLDVVMRQDHRAGEKQDMASHYGVAVLPARVCKPRDKA